MPSILKTSQAPGARRRVTPRTIGAVVLGLALGGAFWYLLHHLQDLMHKNPILVLAFPFTGILFIAALLPVVVFLSYEEDFGNLNPILPTDYFKLCVKTYTAMKDNQWKVSSKDI